jgi:hypothetical protein
MEKKKVTIELVASEDQIVQFLRLCGIIQNLGQLGASRSIKLFVDGDGAARLKFTLRDEKQTHDVPTPKYDLDGDISVGID